MRSTPLNWLIKSLTWRIRTRIRGLEQLVRNISINRRREKLLRALYPSNAGRLILFLTTGHDQTNGGILSIASLYSETQKLKGMHGAEVILCTVPGEPSLLRYTWFENQNNLYGFSQAFSYFRGLQSLMVHIPEYAVGKFLRSLSHEELGRLRKIKDVHLNIVLANLQLFYEKVTPLDISRLKTLGSVTCTTAHERYSTIEVSRKLGIPLHKLSVYVSPEQYVRRRYFEKDPLLIVSPDRHARKAEVLNMIAVRFPHLQIQVVKDLTYEEYKKLVARARWALTFGEGLDGYFVETIFSGGVGFAVYNTTFFTEDFSQLRTVYPDYEALVERICADLARLDNEASYTEYQAAEFDLCHAHYRHEDYIRNLKDFYKANYTFRAALEESKSHSK